MREITVFHSEPQYVLGDNTNIDNLQNKLLTDNKLFAEIQDDYLKSPNEFESEYLRAKKNHLTNTYLYYQLVLKSFYEFVLPSEMEIFKDLQKEEMKQKGWMIPIELANCHTPGTDSFRTEDLYMEVMDKIFDQLFGFQFGEKGSLIDNYYKQAILNYKNSCYYSCAVSLFPIIESCHQAINNFNEDAFYRIKEHLDEVTIKIGKVEQPFVKRVEHYIKLVEQFNDLAKNHYFNKSVERDSEPEIINRNRIMHGLFSRNVSKKDCLQLFCTLSNMYVIKIIISANDQLISLKKELEKFKQK